VWRSGCQRSDSDRIGQRKGFEGKRGRNRLLRSPPSVSGDGVGGGEKNKK